MLEQDGGSHSVVRMEKVCAVTIHAESPYHQEIAASAMPMPGPRVGSHNCSPAGQRESRATACSTPASVTVNAMRTCCAPAGP